MLWLLLIPAVLVFLVVFWFLLPNRLFYADRRPTRLGRLANRCMGWLAAHGMPPSWQVALDVPGRRTGKTERTVLVVAEREGQRYLVSMLGERSAWVKNVRANGGRAVIVHGRSREVRLEETPPGERAPILKAYVERAIGGRPHIPVSRRAPVEAFETVAHLYPVFRIVEGG